MDNICPNCKELNPKVAKFCMHCNTQLVEEEYLSEEDKLRKQIADLKEEKELLKRNKELEKDHFEKLLKEAEVKIKYKEKPVINIDSLNDSRYSTP